MKEDDFGPLPTIHPREFIVSKARDNLQLAVIETVSGLTVGEKIHVVTHVLSNYIASFAKFMVREERHGDPTKPGGWA